MLTGRRSPRATISSDTRPAILRLHGGLDWKVAMSYDYYSSYENSNQIFRHRQTIIYALNNSIVQGKLEMSHSYFSTIRLTGL